MTCVLPDAEEKR